MGYYTQYHLTLEHINDMPEMMPQCEHDVPENSNFCPSCGLAISMRSVADVIRNTIEASEDYYGLHENADASKWYDHDKHMRTLSAKFPSVIFTLHGEGEESGDLWRKYHFRGQRQIAKGVITYDSFDATKLE